MKMGEGFKSAPPPTETFLYSPRVRPRLWGWFPIYPFFRSASMRDLRWLPCVVLVLLFAAACGDSTGPSGPRYPELQGTYDFSAPVNEVEGARFSGSMTLLHADRDQSQFDGTFTMSLIGPDGANYGSGSGDIAAGTVSESGSVNFQFENSQWRWTGRLDGARIEGTWILTGDPNYTGTFTAVRR